MKVFFPIGECAPLAKVGGLGDVGGALPKVLARLGVGVDVFLPKYQVIDEAKYGLKPVELPLEVDFRGRREVVTLFQTVIPNSQVPVYLFQNDRYLSRGPIHFGGGAISSDSLERDRFTFFNLCLVKFLLLHPQRYNLIHAHDWHTGLLFPLLKQAGFNLPSLFTVHNMFYQGVWGKKSLSQAGLDVSVFAPSPKKGEEAAVNFLVQGLVFANRINTVSPQYAREILTPELGAGLSSILADRRDKVAGILNGVDYGIFDPANDPLLFGKYTSSNWQEGKRENKKKLLEELDLPIDSLDQTPLFGMVARLGVQKGIDLLLKACEQVLGQSCQVVVLGIGDAQQEAELRRFGQRFPRRFRARLEFNEPLAHQVYAASDFFLVPSKFEPCGMTQMIAMRYGSLPIVRATGGLADTVTDGIDGFSFEPYKAEALSAKMLEAVQLYHNSPDTREMMVRVAMSKDFSWEEAGEKYIELYREIFA